MYILEYSKKDGLLPDLMLTAYFLHCLRPAYELRNPMMAYNLFQTIFSFWVFSGIFNFKDSFTSKGVADVLLSIYLCPKTLFTIKY